jgi:hypothetical protein
LTILPLLACSSAPKEQTISAPTTITATTTTTARCTLADVEKNLTDTQRAALVAAARALRGSRNPSEAVSPEHAVALLQVDAALKSCAAPGTLGGAAIDSLSDIGFVGVIEETDAFIGRQHKPAEYGALLDVAAAVENADFSAMHQAAARYFEVLERERGKADPKK